MVGTPAFFAAGGKEYQGSHIIGVLWEYRRQSFDGIVQESIVCVSRSLLVELRSLEVHEYEAMWR